MTQLGSGVANANANVQLMVRHIVTIRSITLYSLHHIALCPFGAGCVMTGLKYDISRTAALVGYISLQ